MEVALVRHALPERVERVDGAPADPQLSSVGRAQAERLAGWLAGERFDALYTSPLRRAAETAAPLAETLGLNAIAEPGVAEYDAASSAYVPMEELKAEDPEAWRAAVSGGLYAEIDIHAFRREVVASLDRLIAGHPGQRILVVAHAGVINAFAGHVLGIAEPLFFEPGYTSVSRFLAASSGHRSVHALNETAHLRESRAGEAAKA